MKSIDILMSLWLTVFLLPLTGETHSLQEIILLARENNPQILAAENDLLAADKDLVGTFLMENSALTAKSNWSISEPVNTPGNSSLTLNVPLIDQLSLSASLDNDQKVSAGITLKPLNMTANRVDSQVRRSNAQNSLDYSYDQLDWLVLDKVLTLSLAGQEKKLHDALEVLENKQYQAAHTLYLAGETTYNDYLKAMDDLTNAEENSLNMAEALQKASQDLWTWSGMSESYELEPVDLEVVESLAESLNGYMNDLGDKSALSLSVLTAKNSLLQAEEALDTTLWFHPDLSVSAGVNGTLDGSSKVQSSLSISLTLSGDSFKGEELKILEAEKREKELTLSQSLFENSLEIETHISTIELAEKGLDLAKRDLERSRTLAHETEILFARGERTILEKEEVFLALIQSETGVYEWASALVRAEADYLILFPDLDLDIMDLLIFP